MVQRREQLRLPLEAGQAIGIGGESLGQDLDRHFAVEGGVQRLPDHAHAALADLLDQPIVGQRPAGSQCHDTPSFSFGDSKPGGVRL